MSKLNRDQHIEERQKRLEKGRKKQNHDYHEEVVKELFEQSNKRRIIVRKADGDVLFETPLTVSIVLTLIGVFFFFPVLILITIAAYAMKVRMDIVRDVTEEEVAYLQELDFQQTVYGQLEEDDQYRTLVQ